MGEKKSKIGSSLRIATIATITVYKQRIAIANTVLQVILDHELYPRCSFLQ